MWSNLPHTVGPLSIKLLGLSSNQVYISSLSGQLVQCLTTYPPYFYPHYFYSLSTLFLDRIYHVADDVYCLLPYYSAPPESGCATLALSSVLVVVDNKSCSHGFLFMSSFLSLFPPRCSSY